MAILDQAPTPEHIRSAMGVLNYYVDQYGRWIVRKWRSGKRNFIEQEAQGNESENYKVDHRIAANRAISSRGKI